MWMPSCEHSATSRQMLVIGWFGGLGACCEAVSSSMAEATSTAQSHNHTTTPLVPAVEVEDLTVAYRDKPVLWDIDLTVPQGVLMAVVGPNGAGKTTLLKAI